MPVPILKDSTSEPEKRTKEKSLIVRESEESKAESQAFDINTNAISTLNKKQSDHDTYKNVLS